MTCFRGKKTLLSDVAESRLGIKISGIPRLESATTTFFPFPILSFKKVQFPLRVEEEEGEKGESAVPPSSFSPQGPEEEEEVEEGNRSRKCRGKFFEVSRGEYFYRTLWVFAGAFTAFWQSSKLSLFYFWLESTPTSTTSC